MGAYLGVSYSDDPRDHRRRLERAKRARAQKRSRVERTLREAGWVKIDGIWVSGVSAETLESAGLRSVNVR